MYRAKKNKPRAVGDALNCPNPTPFGVRMKYLASIMTQEIGNEKAIANSPRFITACSDFHYNSPIFQSC